MKDKISEIFEIPAKPKSAMILSADKDDNRARDDADLARKNVRDLIETGREALLDMLEVARASEAPRAYEVVGSLMKQLADMNEQLLTLYKKENDIAIPASDNQPAGNVTQTLNQTIFVGTTTELTKALERINNEHP